VAVDVSGIASVLRAASGTEPLAQPVVRGMVDGLITMLAGWGQLPRRACTTDNRPGRYQLGCDWGAALLRVKATLRLVAVGDNRYALGYWAVDERRLRHLKASPTPSNLADGW
jgi:hypothetical protein